MRQTKLQRYLRFQEMIGLTDKTQFVEQLGKLEFYGGMLWRKS